MVRDRLKSIAEDEDLRKWILVTTRGWRVVFETQRTRRTQRKSEPVALISSALSASSAVHKDLRSKPKQAGEQFADLFRRSGRPLNRNAACLSPLFPRSFDYTSFSAGRVNCAHCACAQAGRSRGKNSCGRPKRRRCFGKAVAARA